MPFVYFIHEDGDLNIFKIGKTENHPADRLDQLQTGNPRKLKIYRWLQVENHNIVEEFLHVRFAEVHVRGEWYCITPDDIDAECKTIAGNNNATISGRWEPYTDADRLNIKLQRKATGKYRGKKDPVDAQADKNRYLNYQTGVRMTNG